VTRARQMDPVTIAVDASTGQLAGLRSFVRGYAAAGGVGDEVTADVVQAIDELACNIIEHGYRGAAGRLELTLELDADALVATLRDAAPPFDPRQIPEPRTDLPLEDRPLGGMGIHLARTLTDGFDHRILPGGGNEVILTKRLTSTDTPEGHDGHHDRSAGS